MNRVFQLVRTCAAIISLGAFASVHAIPGQPGTLDATFNGTGKLLTPVGAGGDTATAALLQLDGKIVLAGGCDNGSDYDFCAVRYLPNGTLDLTFNTTGRLITPVGTGDDFAAAALLQPDGKIVLAGACTNGTNEDFCAVRYLPNGVLDTTFNGTGTVFTPVGSSGDIAKAALLQPDGKIVLAGYCFNGSNNDFCAARYLPNGVLDTTFNGTGTLITPVGTGNDSVFAALLQPDGKIVLAGYCLTGSGNDFCAVRYLPNGALDNTFNGTGKLITAVGTSIDNTAAASLQPDGKIVLAGYCFNGVDNDFCAVRYLPNGALDATFNGTGKLITPAGTSGDQAIAALLQPDGKIVLAGYCFVGGSNDFCAVRYLPNGALDTTFNGTGTLITSVGTGNDYANAALLQPDGKIVLAGTCLSGSTFDFCAVRYDGGPFGYQNCKPDLDGDGLFLATTDALINMRIALGITGNAVIGGIAFAPNATRNTWPLIRDYLVTQCGMSLVQ